MGLTAIYMYFPNSFYLYDINIFALINISLVCECCLSLCLSDCLFKILCYLIFICITHRFVKIVNLFFKCFFCFKIDVTFQRPLIGLSLDINVKEGVRQKNGPLEPCGGGVIPVH